MTGDSLPSNVARRPIENHWGLPVASVCYTISLGVETPFEHAVISPAHLRLSSSILHPLSFFILDPGSLILDPSAFLLLPRR